jgi:uncharacterized Tic20 family protein
MVTTKERLLAALSHAGAFIPGFGIIIPALVWSLRRKKSKYISDQSAQAVAYQIGFNVIYFLVMLVLCILLLLAVLVGFNLMKNSTRPEMFVFLFDGILIGSIVLLCGVYAIIALVGVITCLLGKEFSYPILGKWMHKYLAQPVPDEKVNPATRMESIDRWMAGWGHLAIFIPLWGIAMPLIFLLNADKSEIDFRRESKHAAVFQGIQAAGLLFFQVIIFVLNFIFILFIPAFSQNSSSPDSGMMIAAMGVGLIFLFIILIYLLILAIFQTLGIVAAVKTLQGKKYTYPIIGNWLDKRADQMNSALTPG